MRGSGQRPFGIFRYYYFIDHLLIMTPKKVCEILIGINVHFYGCLIAYFFYQNVFLIPKPALFPTIHSITFECFPSG